MSEHERLSPARLTRILLGAAMALASLGAVTVVLAALWPMPRPLADSSQSGHLPELSGERAGVNELAGALDRRRLLQPSEVQAAVKDSGAAAEMLARLKLRGVVQIGDQPQAYVMVVDEGDRTVRVGDKLLEFEVQKISPGSVELSLQGVLVQLTY